MKNGEITIFLNGLRMNGKREPPEKESIKFVRSLVVDLFCLESGQKHKCTDECKNVWTIAVGPGFTDKETFMECIPE